MTWFKVDDGLHGNRKAARAGVAAMGLWVLAASWCADQLTDGWVPDYIAARLDSDYAEHAKTLVMVRLWEEMEVRGDESGWQFHDWLDYNPSRAEVQAERAAAAERKRRSRDRVRDAESHGVTNADAPPSITPTPTRPVPTRPEPPPPSPPVDGAGFTAEWEEQVVARALALRPDWLAEDIRRALRHRTVRQRPAAVVARAMELIARDPASKRPSRLAANHEHWSQARLQLRAQDHAGGGKVPPHDPVSDGSGGCARCPLPGTHPVHQTHPKDHP